MAKSRKRKRTSGGQSTGAAAGRSEAAAPVASAAAPPPDEEAGGRRAGRAAATAVRPGAFEAPEEELTGSRRVAWWALLALVFVVPIAMGNLTFLGVKAPLFWDAFDMPKMSVARILSLVALAAWAWDMLRRGGKLRHTPVDWLVLAFLAWVAISAATSIHLPTAIFGKARRYEGLISFLDYALIYFLLLQFVDSAARLRRLAQALFWSSIIVSAYGLLQYVGWDPAQWGPLPFEARRAFSTYGNPDLLGALLIFTVTVALGLALFERRRWWRLVYWIGFGINGLVLIVAFTRGAWIGGAIALLVLGVIAWRQRAHLSRIDLVPAIAFAAAGVALIVRSLSSTDEVMNFSKRLASIFQFGAGSGKTRTEIWNVAITAIKERPIFGWGPDTFRLVFPKFKPVEYIRDAGSLSVADNAHNYPLQLATGIGVPGMLLFYAVVVWAGIRSFRTVFTRSGDAALLLVGAFWAAAVGYLVQLFFGVSVTGTTFLLWVALAVALAPTARLIEVRAPRWGAVGAVVVTAACFAGVVYSGIILVADNIYMSSQLATDSQVRVQKIQQAIKLFPYSWTYRWGLGVAYSDEMNMYAQAYAQAQQSGQDGTAYAEAFREAADKAARAFSDTIRFMPDEYDTYVSLADVYNAAGETLDPSYFADAVAVAKDGIRVEPNGTSVRLQLTRALLGQGKNDEAMKLIRATVAMDPMNSQASLMLASILDQQGETEEALAVLQRLETVAPGQEGVADAIATLQARIEQQQ